MGGGRKFRLSDMIPNAWFYKLKDMGKPKPRKHHAHLHSSNSSSLTTSVSSSSSSSSSDSTPSSKTTNSSSLSSSLISTHRTSQYFKRDHPTPPPSTRSRPSTIKNRASSPRRPLAPAKPPAPDSTSEDYPADSSVEDDKSLIRKDSIFHDLQLAPIVTKREPEIKSLEKLRKEGDRSSSVRRLSVSSPGMKLRTNSPKIMNRKLQGSGRRCRKKLSESFAVVKSSVNPKRDFMESMMEMIVENDIKGSKDLEDLLACYLQLNSNEYHEIIVDVFKQIWFDLADTRRRRRNKNK